MRSKCRYSAVVFDLDGTLVDSSALDALRDGRRWQDAVASLHRTHLYDGVREILDGITGQLPWAVVTNSVSFYAERLLSYHGLRVPLLVAYHDAPAKPRPDSCRIAVSKLGVTGRVLGVGDRLTDLVAYQAAGFETALAGWHSESESGSWDYVMEHPSKLLSVLSDAE